MDEFQRLSLANRQMVAERQDLLGQLTQLRSELNQRHVDDATSVIKGLELLVALAEADNPAARLAVRTLAETLEKARALGAGLIVARS